MRWERAVLSRPPLRPCPRFPFGPILFSFSMVGLGVCCALLWRGLSSVSVCWGRLCGRVSRQSILLGVYRLLWSTCAAGEQARRASEMLVGPCLDGRGRLRRGKDLLRP